MIIVFSKEGVMKRQFIAVLTLVSFVIFSVSCYSVREIKLEILTAEKGKEIEIMKLTKTSGESIVFDEDQPGRIEAHIIKGIGATESIEIMKEISNAKVRLVVYEGTQAVSVVMKDGETFPVQKIVKKPEAVEMWIREDVRPLQFEPVSIAISEIRKAYKKTLNIGITLLAVVIPVAYIFAIKDIRIGPMSNPFNWSN
jgi:hypothetical protein